MTDLEKSQALIIKQQRSQIAQLELLISIEASEDYHAAHNTPTHSQLKARVRELEAQLLEARQGRLLPKGNDE